MKNLKVGYLGGSYPKHPYNIREKQKIWKTEEVVWKLKQDAMSPGLKIEEEFHEPRPIRTVSIEAGKVKEKNSSQSFQRELNPT